MIKPFAVFAHGKALRMVGASFLQDYVDWLDKQTSDRTKQQYSAKTIKHAVTVATSVLRWAHDHGYLERMPRAPKLATPDEDPRDIDGDQLRAMFARLDGSTRKKNAANLLRFIALTGCRPSEAGRLRWRELVKRPEGMAFQIEQHKTRRSTGRAKLRRLCEVLCAQDG